MLKSSSQKNHSGFTLLEVVFAVGIILIFLGSLIAVFNVGSKNIVVSKHRLQAANLAREGAESMRQTRDSCWMSPCTSWSTNLAGQATILSAAIPPINLVTFTRTVSIGAATSSCPAASCAKVTSTVTWPDFGQTHTVTMTTYLTNWKP